MLHFPDGRHLYDHLSDKSIENCSSSPSSDELRTPTSAIMNEISSTGYVISAVIVVEKRNKLRTRAVINRLRELRLWDVCAPELSLIGRLKLSGKTPLLGLFRFFLQCSVECFNLNQHVCFMGILVRRNLNHDSPRDSRCDPLCRIHGV